MKYLRTVAAALAVVWCVRTDVALGVDESSTLAQVLAKNAHLAEPQAKEWSEAVVNAIRTELKNGNTVEVASFGRFYVQQRELKPKAGSAGAPGAARLRRYARFSSAPALKNELNGAEPPTAAPGAPRAKPVH